MTVTAYAAAPHNLLNRRCGRGRPIRVTKHANRCASTCRHRCTRGSYPTFARPSSVVISPSRRLAFAVGRGQATTPSAASPHCVSSWRAVFNGGEPRRASTSIVWATSWTTRFSTIAMRREVRGRQPVTRPRLTSGVCGPRNRRHDTPSSEDHRGARSGARTVRKSGSQSCKPLCVSFGPTGCYRRRDRVRLFSWQAVTGIRVGSCARRTASSCVFGGLRWWWVFSGRQTGPD